MGLADLQAECSSLRSCTMCSSASAQAGTVSVMHAGDVGPAGAEEAGAKAGEAAGAAAKGEGITEPPEGDAPAELPPIPLPDGLPMPEAVQARSIDKLHILL